ncbi:hypothetical protein pb186bvf_007380 [Paramecium bursaria]
MDYTYLKRDSKFHRPQFSQIDSQRLDRFGRTFIHSSSYLDTTSQIPTEAQIKYDVMYGILASDKIEKQHYTVRSDVLTEEQQKQFFVFRNENFKLKLQNDELTRKVTHLLAVIHELELKLKFKEQEEKPKIVEKRPDQPPIKQRPIVDTKTQAELEEKDQQIKKLQEEIDKLKLQMDKQQQLLKEKDKQLQDNQILITDLKNQITSLHIQFDSQTTHQTIIDEVSAWKTKYAELNRDYKNTKEELTMLKAEVESNKLREKNSETIRSTVRKVTTTKKVVAALQE